MHKNAILMHKITFIFLSCSYLVNQVRWLLAAIFPKTGERSKTYSAEPEGMFRAPLQGLSESKKFRAWTKCKDSRRATRFAQTISPSALTSMSGTSRFAKTLPKSPCPHPQPPQKGFRKGAVFCFIGWESHRIINREKQRRGLKALLFVKPSGRAFVSFSLLGSNYRSG